MKTLIAYFSLDGNTKWIAEKLHRKLPNTTIHAIELASKPIKGKLWRTMIYGFKATFYKDMAIKPSALDMAEYDTVIIGAPVWMGKVPPPVKAFLTEYSLKEKKVVAFCSMGGEPNRFFDQLEDLSGGRRFDAFMAMVEPLQNLTKDNFEKVDEFVEEIVKVFDLKEEVA